MLWRPNQRRSAVPVEVMVQMHSTRTSETMADPKSATGEEPVRIEEVKELKASHEGDAMPGLAEASDSEDEGSGDEVVEAIGGLRMHGPSLRDMSFRPPI